MQGLLDAGPSMPKQILPRPSKLYFWIFAKRKIMNWKKGFKRKSENLASQTIAIENVEGAGVGFACCSKLIFVQLGTGWLGNTWPLAAGQCVRKNGHFVAAVRWNVVWKVCGCPDSWYSPVTRRHSDTVKPAGSTLEVGSADPGGDV